MDFQYSVNAQHWTPAQISADRKNVDPKNLQRHANACSFEKGFYHDHFYGFRSGVRVDIPVY